LQGLFYQLKKGVDDLGRLGFGENVLGKECFDEMGFCDSHRLDFLHRNEHKAL